MPSSRYAAPPNQLVVSSAQGTGREIRITFDKHGFYTATDEDEIRALDDVAELEAHPVSFAPTTKKGV